MAKHLEKLKKNLPFHRWVHHEDLHITLAFLGFAPAEKLARAEKNMKEAIIDSKAFQLQINRLGTFGKEDAPRVFWADVVESSELQLLRRKVVMACEHAGFQLDTRDFRPHITLARKWVGNDAFQKELLTVWSKLQLEPLAFVANDVVLYQTHLQRMPKYEAKTVFQLE
jgi:2'-5' RNA ligase